MKNSENWYYVMITKVIGEENTFPNYKHGRRKDRKASTLDWGSIFDTLHLIKQELEDNFPYKVLEVENAEADDIIASVVRYVAETPSLREGIDCIW